MRPKRGKLWPGVSQYETPLAALLAIRPCSLPRRLPRRKPFPAGTITIVTPAPAGGVTDIIGRALAQRFSKSFGQQAVAEDKPGANNQIAAGIRTTSPPDGNLISFVAPDGTFVVNPSLYPKLPYDPYKSFTPSAAPAVINQAPHPAIPVLAAESASKELIELAKQKPGSINYGTFGIGSSGHLNMVLLETMTGAKFRGSIWQGRVVAGDERMIAGYHSGWAS